jgi:hypothetical protein
MTIKYTKDIQTLTGIGEEWLIHKDGDTILFKFMDGKIVGGLPEDQTNCTEVTPKP